MGYTHYFPQTRSFTKDEWNQVKDGVKSIVRHCLSESIKLQFEYNDKRPPEISEKIIRFNGEGDLGHETFYVSKVMNHNSWENKTQPAFQFCKTARKPYDLAVCLSLLRIKSVAPDVLNIGSDGDEEWNQVYPVYKTIFGEESPRL